MILQEIKKAFTNNKNLLLISAILFIASLILGFFFQPVLHSFFNPVVQQLSNNIQSGVITISMDDIFLNNLSIIIRLYLFGFFIIFSPILLVYNGFFLGYYIASASNLFITLLLIIPHGIFELPSCVIATGAGLVLTKFLIKFLNDLFIDEKTSLIGKIKISYNKNFRLIQESLILFAVSLILMFIAAVIEVYFTTSIANWIISFFI